MTRRVLIYRRISADPEGKRAGVERQEAECRALAESLGWIVLDGVLEPDNDISAYSGKTRPQYRKLLEELRAGRADAVIAWHPDRLYRRLAELEAFIDVVNGHGVAVRTVKAGEMDLSTPTGRAMARTAAVWSGHEVEHGIERMRSAKDQAATEGRWRGGSRPFGFEPDGVTIRDSEAREIREAVRRVLAGESLRSIVGDWRDRGVPTSKGGKWQIGAVRYVLRRARNGGLIERRGEVVGPAQWEPILSEHEFLGVRALLSDPARSTTTTRDRRWLGSGLFLCGVCDDGTLVRIGSAGGARGGSAYRCRAHGHLTRSAVPVDTYVGEVMVAVLSRPEIQLRLHDIPEDDLAAMQSEATAIREELDELRRALGDRTIDLRTFKIASERMQADLAKVEARLTASSSRSPLSGVADADDVAGAWEAATVARKRAIVAELVTVTLLPARRGRQPGGGYFDPDSVQVAEKS